MIAFYVEGFGNKSTDLLMKLIHLEDKVQKKLGGWISQDCVFITGIMGGKQRYIEIQANSRRSFARGCAILKSISGSTPGGFTVRGKLLKRAVRIGPRKPPKIDKKR